MKTYERKTETREVKVIKSLVCDRCEKEIELVEKTMLQHGYAGVTLEINAGYGSTHDFVCSENNWNFDVCDACTTEILKSFKKDYLTVNWSDDE